MSELSTNLNNLDTIVNIPQQIVINPAQIEIRPVNEDEIHCVADIITRSFHFDRGWMAWFTPLFKIGIAEDLRNRLRTRVPSALHSKPQQQVCLIALCVDGAQSCISGTVEVGVRTAERYRQNHYRYVYLSNLAVSKDFRRRGVAQKLIESCEQQTLNWGYTEIHLHVMGNNERGRNLYQKLGYEVVSSELVWSIIPWHRPERLFLRKQLVIGE
ncbi:MAG: GNAT family N-acetyltransferase [Chamaesiphon sp.]|nr:GNAT family N-acetyltransferase [Chamaesiphon sp.]